MKSILRGIVLMLSSLLLTNCSDNVEDLYAHVRAFLRFTPVSAVHPLHAALNNPGVFCQITLGPKTYDFQGADGVTASWPKTALEAYGKPECIAGFVAGISSVPDMNMQQHVVAFDLVCPNCYESASVQRALVFSDMEEMTCPRCHRVYDLKDNGIVKSGDPGKKLYRYRAAYANDLLFITN